MQLGLLSNKRRQRRLRGLFLLFSDDMNIVIKQVYAAKDRVIENTFVGGAVLLSMHGFKELG